MKNSRTQTIVCSLCLLICFYKTKWKYFVIHLFEIQKPSKQKLVACFWFAHVQSYIQYTMYINGTIFISLIPDVIKINSFFHSPFNVQFVNQFFKSRFSSLHLLNDSHDNRWCMKMLCNWFFCHNKINEKVMHCLSLAIV